MSQFRKTLLIVCEGEKSEPNYFKALRDLVIQKDKDIFITIDPIPPKQKEEEEEARAFQLREGGKRRQMKEVAIKHPDLEVEEIYRAQPLYYVRKAQIGLQDGLYEESWAVYDKDGHAKHEEAFALAQNVVNDSKVQIAFNSIAFEYWILLHFELSFTAFTKSMCRTRLAGGKKEEFYCGSNVHTNDCQGANCVCGRIVTQHYLDYEGSRKSFEFSNYHPQITTAISNAVAVRNSYIGTTVPIYDRNPYTTTDRLVFKLMHIASKDFTWFAFEKVQTLGQLSFGLTYNNGIIDVTVTNNSAMMTICPEDSFVLVNVDGAITPCGVRKNIPPAQNNIATFPIDLNQFVAFHPLYVAFKLSETSYLISEIPK